MKVALPVKNKDNEVNQEWISLRRKIVSEARRIVIKLGSAILTREDGLNLVAIARTCDQIARLREEGREFILVSSGAISAGMRKLSMARRPRSITEKQAVAAIGQSSPFMGCCSGGKRERHRGCRRNKIWR